MRRPLPRPSAAAFAAAEAALIAASALLAGLLLRDIAGDRRAPAPSAEVAAAYVTQDEDILDSAFATASPVAAEEAVARVSRERRGRMGHDDKQPRSCGPRRGAGDRGDDGRRPPDRP